MINKYERISYLVNFLNDCIKFYDEGHPIITDKEYDEKYFELKSLEEEFNLVLSNSPTQSITYEVVNSLSKVEHNHKMLSLDKTKSLTDVLNFVGNKNFLAMCKMDGLTCSLTYRNGELFSAETRGNGIIGEDILHNAKTLSSIPLKIPYKDELIIDGEIICTYKDFENFNSEYKNPRNFAAGSIRLLDARECANRNLTFVSWDVKSSLYFENGIEYRLDQKLDWLSSFGFTIVPFINLNGISSTIHSLESCVEEIQKLAQENSYPIDGIVFKFNDCGYGRSLGETAHHFKDALAYKFYDEVYTTQLLNIEWSMGRTGVLTPIAIFEPIDIDGSTVERASLHNISVMKELLGEKPYLRQSLEIYRANMIIPQVYSAGRESNPSDIFEIPKVCPICGEPVIERTDINSTVLFCENPNCEGKLINRLENFCSKKGLDIKGISKATLEKLIEWGWVESFTDIFELTQHRNEWISKSGFGVKSVDKILNSIQLSCDCELSQFIAALGIPLIGTSVSKELVKYFPTWNDFIEAINNNFAFYSLPNFGTEMHNKIIQFNYTEACLLVDHYIHFNTSNSVEDPVVGIDLSGKTFAITGKLKHFKNRDEISSLIESLGGKVSSSVSKNTNYLINNDVDSSSSKNMTAKSLNIPILSEEDFIATFGINN